jgi:hypothetical protein
MSSKTWRLETLASSDFSNVYILIFAFVLLTWPVILTERGSNNFEYGQRTSHLPIIHAMTEEWPDVDLANYSNKALDRQDVAMTPNTVHLSTLIEAL